MCNNLSAFLPQEAQLKESAARDAPPGLGGRPGLAPSRADSASSSGGAPSGNSAAPPQQQRAPPPPERRPIAIVAPPDAAQPDAAQPVRPLTLSHAVYTAGAARALHGRCLVSWQPFSSDLGRGLLCSSFRDSAVEFAYGGCSLQILQNMHAELLVGPNAPQAYRCVIIPLHACSRAVSAPRNRPRPSQPRPPGQRLARRRSRSTHPRAPQASRRWRSGWRPLPPSRPRLPRYGDRPCGGLCFACWCRVWRRQRCKVCCSRNSGSVALVMLGMHPVSQ